MDQILYQEEMSQESRSICTRLWKDDIRGLYLLLTIALDLTHLKHLLGTNEVQGTLSYWEVIFNYFCSCLYREFWKPHTSYVDI